MKVRTLAEAAAEVLAKSKASATAEPTKKLEGEVHDLGGATYDHPEGTSVGTAAAGVVGSATAPGKPSTNAPEAMKKLPPQEQNKVKALANPPAGTAGGSPSATAGHALAQVAEEEVVEDEVISEDEILEDEEVVSEEEGTDELSEEEIQDAIAAKHQWMREKMQAMGVQEDIDALFNNEDLSEEFREKAKIIFEAAVIARAIPVVEEIENEILTIAEESIEETKAELEEQIDTYLNYMVEEWVTENTVAIESGLRNEIVENFIDQLKNLFVENYMDIPEEKVDVIEVMAEEIEDLKNQLNASLNEKIELTKKINESKKSDIVLSVCEGLTATQAEKVKTLAEGVEFTTEGEYAKKLNVIRENYVAADNSAKVKQAATNPIALTESEVPVVTENSSQMDRYVRAISRTLPK